MNYELPKPVLVVVDKLKEHGYSTYIYGECVRLLIQGQTPLDYDLTTDADSDRIAAIFDEKQLQGFITLKSHLRGELVAFLNENASLTFDAIAYAPNRELIDPFNGVEALQKGILTLLLGKSVRRVDLETVLMWKNASEALTQHSKLFVDLIPELTMLDSKQLSLTFNSVGNSSPILSLRYALLFDLLGKPDCLSKTPDGEESFHGEHERSRIYAKRIMTRLDCSPDIIAEVEHIIEHCRDIIQNPRRVQKHMLQKGEP